MSQITTSNGTVKKISYLNDFEILECGANFGHEYYFLAYVLSTLLFTVYHVYPNASCLSHFLCVTRNVGLVLVFCMLLVIHGGFIE